MVFFVSSFLHIGLEGNRALISSGISILTFPDGRPYTPEALPNEPNCSSSHQLPTQEPLRRTRVDMQLTEISVPTDTTPCLSLSSPAASLDARQPVGTGSALIRRSIGPKRRRVRWLSAKQQPLSTVHTSPTAAASSSATSVNSFGSTSRCHRLPRLYARTLNCKRTSLARNQ
jgi:hypothetical protein